MGRLDNIIKRNRTKRFSEKALSSFVIGGIILLILALAVFTDLGKPPTPDRPPAPPQTQSHDHHVDDIKLWRQPAKPK